MVLFCWLGNRLRFEVKENPLLIAPDCPLRCEYICDYLIVLHNTHERVFPCIHSMDLVCSQRICKHHIHFLPYPINVAALKECSLIVRLL